MAKPKPKIRRARKKSKAKSKALPPGTVTKESSCASCRIRKVRCSGTRPACTLCLKAAAAQGLPASGVRCLYSGLSMFATVEDKAFEAAAGGRGAKCVWGESTEVGAPEDESSAPEAEQCDIKVEDVDRGHGYFLPPQTARGRALANAASTSSVASSPPTPYGFSSSVKRSVSPLTPPLPTFDFPTSFPPSLAFKPDILAFPPTAPMHSSGSGSSSTAPNIRSHPRAEHGLSLPEPSTAFLPSRPPGPHTSLPSTWSAFPLPLFQDPHTYHAAFPVVPRPLQSLDAPFSADELPVPMPLHFPPFLHALEAPRGARPHPHSDPFPPASAHAAPLTSASSLPPPLHLDTTFPLPHDAHMSSVPAYTPAATSSFMTSTPVEPLAASTSAEPLFMDGRWNFSMFRSDPWGQQDAGAGGTGWIG